MKKPGNQARFFYACFLFMKRCKEYTGKIKGDRGRLEKLQGGVTQRFSLTRV